MFTIYFCPLFAFKRKESLEGFKYKNSAVRCIRGSKSFAMPISFKTNNEIFWFDKNKIKLNKYKFYLYINKTSQKHTKKLLKLIFLENCIVSTTSYLSQKIVLYKTIALLFLG